MTPALPVGCVIALLGADGTGKTELAGALALRLAQRGIAAALVSDHRSEWSRRERRAPRSDEQAAIGAEQTRRIARAAENSVVVADTTALVTAVHGELLSGDASLYNEALAAHRSYSVTLLMALGPDHTPDRERMDALLRSALTRARAPYAVIHGNGPERLAAAWNAINSSAEAAGDSASNPRGARTWFWPCDKCSDPACEHRLFSDLVAQRAAPDTP